MTKQFQQTQRRTIRLPKGALRVAIGLAAALSATTALTPAFAASLNTTPIQNNFAPPDDLDTVMALLYGPVIAGGGSLGFVLQLSGGFSTSLWDGTTETHLTMDEWSGTDFVASWISFNGDSLFGTADSADHAKNFGVIYRSSGDYTILSSLSDSPLNESQRTRYSGADSNLDTIIGKGYRSDATDSEDTVPVYWTADGQAHALTTGSWTGGQATLVSGDGNVIYGQLQTGILGERTYGNARWNIDSVDSGVMEEFDLSTYDPSFDGVTAIQFTATDYTGDVAVGMAGTDTDTHAFRWSTTGGFKDLGLLAGFTSSLASKVSKDGTVVAGLTYAPPVGDAQVSVHAFSWKETSGQEDISMDRTDRGEDPFYDWVTGMSSDGNIIVGNTFTGYSGTDLSAFGTATSSTAFRWSAANGFQTVDAFLTSKGLNVVGYTFNSIGSIMGGSGLSEDGSVMIGYGRYLTDDIYWLARCGEEDGCGVTTVDGVAESVASVGQAGETSNLYIDDMLARANGASSSATGPTGSVYAYGAYDSDPMAQAGLGINFKIGPTAVAGLSVGQARIDTDLAYDGNSSFDATSLTAYFADHPDSGLDWEAGAAFAALDGTVTRGYLNGADLAASSGDTNGQSAGANARVGWRFANVLENTAITPYAAYSYSHSAIDGWTEEGGPFPATIADFAISTQMFRLGADLSHDFGNGVGLTAGLAAVHRQTESDGVTFDLDGLLDGTVGAQTGATTWAEVSLGLSVPMGDAASGLFKVTGRLPQDGESSYYGQAALNFAF